MKLHRNAALSWNGRRQLADRVVKQGWTLTRRRPPPCQRPSLLDHSIRELTPTIPTERRVTVKLHPDASLGLELPRQRSASKAARMNQPAQELQLEVAGLARNA